MALGWDNTSCPTVEDDLVLEERVAEKWLEEYNKQAGEMLNKQTIAQWNYGANITDYNQEVMVRNGVLIVFFLYLFIRFSYL